MHWSNEAMTKTFTCIHFIEAIRSELGGVVSAVVDVCQAVAARGHCIIVATCDGTDAPAEWRSADAGSPRLVELPPSSLTGKLISGAGVARFGQLLNAVDVAHLHTPWSLGNYQLSKTLRSSQIPYVVSVHGMLDHYSMQKKSLKKHTFLRLGGRRLFRDATAIHFTAEEERTQALHYIPGADRTVVEPCLVDLSPYDRLPGPELALQTFPHLNACGPKLLFLSRVHPKKGVDLLIRAAAELRKHFPELEVFIAGPGEERYIGQLRNLATELNIGSSIHFLGMVRGETKLSLYQTANVFVLSTYQENFGIVLPEAMACGLPVVTTRGTDIWRELQQGGVCIVDAEPSAIAAGVGEILRDPAKAAAMSAQGNAFVRQWLDSERLAARYEIMYLDAITRGLPPFTVAVAPSVAEVTA